MELRHHGILGQKWGRKNGPPYPLGSSDHSAAEKKAGWRKSLKKAKGGNHYIDGTLTKKGYKKLGRYPSRKDIRHLVDDYSDDYVLKKGTKVTRVLQWDEDANPGSKKKAEDYEKQNKVKYGSVDNFLNRGVEGTEYYLSWFSDGGYTINNTAVVSYDTKKDVKVANGHKVMDYLLDKYGDLTLKELGGITKDKTEKKKYDSVLVKNIYKDASLDSQEKYAKERASIGSRVFKSLTMKTALRGEYNEMAKYFAKKGYDAFEDINDRDTSMPVVFINSDKSLKKTSEESGLDWYKKHHQT